jgi:glycosyltransferase involved in cell wall biosynthesis
MVAEGPAAALPVRTLLLASSRPWGRPRLGGRPIDQSLPEDTHNGMTQDSPTTDVPLVLHVIPTARARGAQREARALADHLDTPGVRHHRVLSLFAGPDEVVVDRSLEQPGGDTPAVGFDGRLVLRLRRTLGQMDPDVVVAHGSEPLKFLVPAMVGRRRPLAYYAIGTYSGSDRTSQLRLWRTLVSRADRIAAEGEEVREECIERLGVPPHRVVVTPNGRDPGVFHPAHAGEPGGGEQGSLPVHLLFVGALTSGKRPERFVEVVAALRSRGLELRATMIGDGPLRAAVALPAEKARVELLGSRSDVAEQMRRADLMIFPSRPEGEGMPGVLIEAALSGLPVVATAVPGVASIVQDGQTGLVVPVDDLEAMVSATRTLVEDGRRRRRLGQAGRQRGLDHFSLDAVGRVWMDLLRPLLDQAARTRRPRR